MNLTDNPERKPRGPLVAAAVRDGVDGKIWIACRHWEAQRDAVAELQAEGREDRTIYFGVDDHGFVTENGRFLMREQAKHYAIVQGQLDRHFMKTLTSEDLWTEAEWENPFGRDRTDG